MELIDLLNSVTQMITFLTWIPDFDSYSPALLDLLLFSDFSIFSKVTFPPLSNSEHVDFSVSTDS